MIEVVADVVGLPAPELAEGYAFAAYAASAGDNVLIRPDGYLG